MKGFKRLFLFILTGIMTITITGSVKAMAYGSSGMETSKVGDKTFYLVKTEDQLRSIGKGKYLMSYDYMLDGDIALTKEWKAIGTEEKPFTGSFNGNGFTISNLKMTDKKAKYIGLFGYVEKGTIYNVTLKNVDIDSAGGKGKHAAPVVAICLDGKVYDNYVVK